MQHLRSRVPAGLVALLPLLAACGSGTEPEPGPQTLTIVSGNNQTAEAGETLASPLIVSVTQDGTPVSGVTVTWAVTAGGGSVDPTSSTTGAAGTASTTLTLGASAGANTVQASASGVSGSPRTFNATGTAPPAPPPLAATVEVDDNFFNPTNQPLAEGGTVTWSWVGSQIHNVHRGVLSSASSASQNRFVVVTSPDAS